MNCLCSRFAMFVHCFGEATDSANYVCWLRFVRVVLRTSFYLMRYLSVVLCKVFVQEGTVLGTGISLSGKGNIIVGAEKIGDECVIHHNVTFGMHLTDNESFMGKPIVGDRVWIGPNTIVHGNIKIGDGVTILGGTVLTKNVPARSVVSGNPAKIVCRDFDNSRLLGSSCYDVSPLTIKEWS